MYTNLGCFGSISYFYSIEHIPPVTCHQLHCTSMISSIERQLLKPAAGFSPLSWASPAQNRSPSHQPSHQAGTGKLNQVDIQYALYYPHIYISTYLLSFICTSTRLLTRSVRLRRPPIVYSYASRVTARHIRVIVSRDRVTHPSAGRGNYHITHHTTHYTTGPQQTRR